MSDEPESVQWIADTIADLHGEDAAELSRRVVETLEPWLTKLDTAIAQQAREGMFTREEVQAFTLKHLRNEDPDTYWDDLVRIELAAFEEERRS